MTLKEFIEESFKQSPMSAMQTMRDLVELEGIENKLNAMWGIELEINVKPAPKHEGRFYGKSLIEKIWKDK